MEQNTRFRKAVVAVGSNIERERHLPEAIRLMRRNDHIEVERVSRLYESPSVGGPGDAPDFFNAAVLVCTKLSPVDLRAELRSIEAALGRVRTSDPNSPRTVDLDVVYFADTVGDFDGWQLPDPQAAVAPHVAIPVADIVPDWQDPTSGRSAREIAEQLDANGVQPVMAIQLSTPYVSRAPEDFDDLSDVYAPKLEGLVREQLFEIGEDPDREGLVRTPLRVAKALDYLTSGYTTSVDEVVNNALFDAEGAEEMVLVKDIEFYSMCEHHMLPFFGKAAVAYLPKGTIIGLSKIARLVDVYARRLQVQERLTNQVADALSDTLDPHGVAVVMEGKHLCMMCRSRRARWSPVRCAGRFGPMPELETSFST
jgi:GTP cyclohydrolase I